ncbi:myosin light chain 3 [Platysternon megacephalum]|uniref:Myosin light chain 3 n=1 Tax=Platysternon megacephalum TaxID=55544 RepID=A0A4D9EFI7_9SAUR|nr:myosin light chain 3 [Platysternon megacephalum]
MLDDTGLRPECNKPAGGNSKDVRAKGKSQGRVEEGDAPGAGSSRAMLTCWVVCTGTAAPCRMLCQPGSCGCVCKTLWWVTAQACCPKRLSFSLGRGGFSGAEGRRFQPCSGLAGVWMYTVQGIALPLGGQPGAMLPEAGSRGDAQVLKGQSGTPLGSCKQSNSCPPKNPHRNCSSQILWPGSCFPLWWLSRVMHKQCRESAAGPVPFPPAPDGPPACFCRRTRPSWGGQVLPRAPSEAACLCPPCPAASDETGSGLGGCLALQRRNGLKAQNSGAGLDSESCLSEGGLGCVLGRWMCWGGECAGRGCWRGPSISPRAPGSGWAAGVWQLLLTPCTTTSCTHLGLPSLSVSATCCLSLVGISGQGRALSLDSHREALPPDRSARISLCSNTDSSTAAV